MAKTVYPKEKFSNPNPMPEKVGGYEIGTTFDNVNYNDVLNGLLYPYQYPEFASFISALFTIYEVGTTLNNVFAATYTINNFSNVKANSDVSWESSNNAVVIGSKLALETDNIDIGINSLALNTVGTTVVTLSGNNSKDKTFTIDGYIYARKYFYHYLGNTGTSPIANIDVRALNKSFLDANNTGIFNIAIPAYTQEVSFYIPNGKMISVIDTGNLNNDITSVFVSSSFTMTHDNGLTTTYNKWTGNFNTGYPSDTNFKITIL